MKTFVVTVAALLMLWAAPASAMSCCGSGKGKAGMMCGKTGMAMKHADKDKKGGCCENTGSNMSKRS